MRLSKLFVMGLLAAVISTACVSAASASSVFFAGSGITLSLGDIDMRSYDGPGFNSVNAASNVVPLNFMQYSSFDGGPAGTEYEVFFLSSVAAYKNQNEFGLLNEKGEFVSSVKGSSKLGTSTTYTQGTNERLSFGFKSPESLFHADKEKNADKREHMLVVQATQNALLTIPRADLMGNSTSFNLLAGDMIFFIEDMLQFSTAFGGRGADFDYNDFIAVVRAKPIPEPATVFLLGAGSLLALRRRKQGSI